MKTREKFVCACATDLRLGTKGRARAPASLARQFGQLEQASQGLGAAFPRSSSLDGLLSCQPSIAPQRAQPALLGLLACCLRRCCVRLVHLGEAVQWIAADSLRQPHALLQGRGRARGAGLLGASCSRGRPGCSRRLAPQRRSRKAGALLRGAAQRRGGRLEAEAAKQAAREGASCGTRDGARGGKRGRRGRAVAVGAALGCRAGLLQLAGGGLGCAGGCRLGRRGCRGGRGGR